MSKKRAEVEPEEVAVKIGVVTVVPSSEEVTVKVAQSEIGPGRTPHPAEIVKAMAADDDASKLRAAINEHKESSWRTHGHPRAVDVKLYKALD
jgi:hypothetical protein